jgi:ABC-2 type transport system permease protein
VPSPAGYLSVFSLLAAACAGGQATRLLADPHRHRYLTLYLTRSITRTEYLGCRWCALVLALSPLPALPAVLLLAGSNRPESLGELLAQLAEVIAVVIVISAGLASLAMAFSILSRRAGWGTALLVLYLVVTAAVFSATRDSQGDSSLPTSVLGGLNPFSAAKLLTAAPAWTAGVATVITVVVVCAACLGFTAIRHRNVTR